MIVYVNATKTQKKMLLICCLWLLVRAALANGWTISIGLFLEGCGHDLGYFYSKNEKKIPV